MSSVPTPLRRSILVRLEADLYEDLSQCAQQDGVSLSAMVRQCLRVGLLAMRLDPACAPSTTHNLSAYLARLACRLPRESSIRARRIGRAINLERSAVEAWMVTRLTRGFTGTARRLAIESLGAFGLPQVILPSLIRLARRVRNRLDMQRRRASEKTRMSGNPPDSGVP